MYVCMYICIYVFIPFKEFLVCIYIRESKRDKIMGDSDYGATRMIL